jgi:hypothetical protein
MMQSRLSLLKLLAVFMLMAASISCETPASNSNNRNATNGNANTAASTAQGGLPQGAQPVTGVPGTFMAGPSGDVALQYSAPVDGATIEGNSVAPTFSVTNFPIYMDSARNKGQHIHVIIDNEPYEANYNPAQPFNHAKLQNLAPGTHTLRAFPSREWHESIKEPDGSPFDFVVFHVGQPTVQGTDASQPLLTYSRPKGDYKLNDDPRGLMLDFYLTNAPLGPGQFKVRYTLSKDGKPVKTEELTRWEPVWWSWTDMTPGEYKVLLELLDATGKPVAFKVGNLDYNRTERTFRVLAEGAQAGAGPANSNASGNSNASH